jgi:hypothetical protein
MILQRHTGSHSDPVPAADPIPELAAPPKKGEAPETTEPAQPCEAEGGTRD